MTSFSLIIEPRTNCHLESDCDISCAFCISLLIIEYAWVTPSHSRIWPYFFPYLHYLPTCEVNLIEVLKIMAQMGPYNIFLSLKPTKMTSDFILSYLKKVVGGATTQKYQKQILKPWYILYGSAPRGPWGVKRCARVH